MCWSDKTFPVNNPILYDYSDAISWKSVSISQIESTIHMIESLWTYSQLDLNFIKFVLIFDIQNFIRQRKFDKFILNFIILFLNYFYLQNHLKLFQLNYKICIFKVFLQKWIARPKWILLRLRFSCSVEKKLQIIAIPSKDEKTFLEPANKTKDCCNPEVQVVYQVRIMIWYTLISWPVLWKIKPMARTLHQNLKI